MASACVAMLSNPRILAMKKGTSPFCSVVRRTRTRTALGTFMSLASNATWGFGRIGQVAHGYILVGQARTAPQHAVESRKLAGLVSGIDLHNCRV